MYIKESNALPTPENVLMLFICYVIAMGTLQKWPINKPNIAKYMENVQNMMLVSKAPMMLLNLLLRKVEKKMQSTTSAPKCTAPIGDAWTKYMSTEEMTKMHAFIILDAGSSEVCMVYGQKTELAVAETGTMKVAAVDLIAEFLLSEL